jgi:hypothetical protein
VTARLIRRSAGALAALALIVTLAACTKSTPTEVTTSTETQTTTTTPAIGQTGSISVGKVTEKTVKTCPYLTADVAAGDAGMRLKRIVTLIQNKKVVGCRFYPDVFTSENLPPTSQLAIEILTSKYASDVNAHNAIVRIASAGTNPQQDEVATGNTGVCYQTTVWSKDNGKDWACTFSKGSTVVVIRTVVTSPALNVVGIAKAVYPKI